MGSEEEQEGISSWRDTETFFSKEYSYIFRRQFLDDESSLQLGIEQ